MSGPQLPVSKLGEYLEAPAVSLARLAETKGDTRVIVEPQPNELFVDLDVQADLRVLEHLLKVLEHNGVEAVITRNTPSRTAGHAHVVVRVDRVLTPLERIALQACLGSDRKRELLALLRVWAGVSYAPTVFFEEPDGEAE